MKTKAVIQKVATILLGLSTVVLFQNCGSPHSALASGSQSSSSVPNESLSQSLALMTTSTVGPSISSYVKPISIKFGNVALAYMDCTITWPIDDQPIPNNPIAIQKSAKSMELPCKSTASVFSDFSLDLLHRNVTDSSGQVLLVLSGSQVSQLRKILKGSVVAKQSVFGVSDQKCLSPNLTDYAVIVGDQGQNIELQGAACDGTDLFNYASGQAAGLKGFLDSLEDQINDYQIGIL